MARIVRYKTIKIFNVNSCQFNFENPDELYLSQCGIRDLSTMLGFGIR